MQTARMIAIALLAGIVSAGLVWYGWSIVENIAAARAARKKDAPAKKPTTEETPSDKESKPEKGK